MLIQCYECELQVSDKAVACPHCGAPSKTSDQKSHRAKIRKRKRLPNGFGQITELKNNNLRNRFRVMITVGKDSYGKPICKLLKPNAYFKTYNDAYNALLDYHRDPCSYEKSITVSDLYMKWIEEYRKELKNESSLRTINAAWAYCSELYNQEIKNVRTRHLKHCIENAKITLNGEVREASSGTKSRMKSVFNLLFDYALEYELTDRNYARNFSLSKEIIRDKVSKTKSHTSFTDREIELLWENVESIKYVDMILIQCYSGWRPQELCELRICDVDLENWTFKGGMKTEAGRNRVVPILKKIKGLVKAKYDEAVSLDSEYLFNCTDGKRGSSLKFTYDKYGYRFDRVVKALKLNPEHRPHDPRKHFVTICKKYKVDEYAIKYLVGHSISDITEKVYTDRDMEWLRKEVKKIEEEWTL